MEVLVLGGTGAMGAPLVQYLINDGHQVYVTSRKEHVSKDNLIYIKGDAHNSKFLTELLQKRWDAIVDFMIYEEEEFNDRINSLLTSTEHYIFLSTARVYANSDMPLKEDSYRLLDVCKDEDYLATSEYSLKKAREEDLLLKSGYKNFTIIRPYITYNNERLQLGFYEKEHWLPRALSGRTVVFSEDIAHKKTTLTYGDDVAHIISKCLGKEKAMGEIIQITSGESMHWNDILEIYSSVIEETIGIKVSVKYVKNADVISKSLGRYSQVKYDRIYDRVFCDSNEKLYDIIGENYKFMSTEEGLKRCITQFLREEKNYRYKKVVCDAYMDKIAKQYGSIKSYKGKDLIKYFICRFTPYFTIKDKLRF